MSTTTNTQVPRHQAGWASYFNDLGANYDDWAFTGAGLQTLAQRELRQVTRALGGGAGRRVLDIGAGTGRFSVALNRAGWKITALDAAPEMLSVVSERVPDATTVEGRLGEPLPFEDATFDAVVAMRVIKYVHNTGAALAELARVAAPGAKVVFDLCNSRSLARVGYPGGTIGFVTPSAATRLATAAGLIVVAVHAGPRLPHPAYQRATGDLAAMGVGAVEGALRLLARGTVGARSLVLETVRAR